MNCKDNREISNMTDFIEKDFVAGLLKHGIRALEPEQARKRLKEMVMGGDVDTDMDMDVDMMEDIQMANEDSCFTMQDGEDSLYTMRDEDSLNTKNDQQTPNQETTPKDIGPFLTKLPAEMRNHIYDQILTDCHMSNTTPSKETPTEAQTESQITKMVDAVLKSHPMILLHNHQITSEYSGRARSHIIHALTTNVSALPHLHTTHPTLPLTTLTRLKLTIDFGNRTNDVDHASVRGQIVAFARTLPQLVDLQIVYRHEQVVNPVTNVLMNDWQTVRARKGLETRTKTSFCGEKARRNA
ncbi:hypothetical protein BLS_004993 [Venturia inaequalis]|uniref:Uncharacterized protein n=1 Tax=Venturia inaequalis TaxID=5025 RepID=A0A8H3YV48_VENIN|nr:hypothetical protein BLS_004993 [Venturia inaequalis]